MRKSILALALGASFTASLVTADQTTLDAIIASGIELTPEQSVQLQNAQDASTLLSAIGNVLPTACTSEESIEAFMKAVASSNPTLVEEITNLAISTCPADLIDNIIAGIIEGQAPAAGIDENTDFDALIESEPTAAGTEASPFSIDSAPRSVSAGGNPSSES